ncbi:hypothetical protein Droror1_Dr00020210 [Drosera rotundifolia]
MLRESEFTPHCFDLYTPKVYSPQFPRYLHPLETQPSQYLAREIELISHPHCSQLHTPMTYSPQIPQRAHHLDIQVSQEHNPSVIWTSLAADIEDLSDSDDKHGLNANEGPDEHPIVA